MPTNVIMPQMGESVAEGTITRWMKKVGETVERDEPLFEISTDKVDAEIPSPAAGVLARILVKETETVAVNTVVAVIDGEGKPSARAAEEPVTPPVIAPTAPAAPSPPPPAAATTRPQPVRSSPVVQRMAAEHQIDLAQVQGTGLGGRVSKRDVLAYLAQQTAARRAAVGPASISRPSSIPSSVTGVVFTGPKQVVPMTPMRQQIAEHMVMSKRTSAHVTTVFEVEMTKVHEVVAREAGEFERRNALKLTYTPFFVRAAVEALKQSPMVNASVEGANLVYRRDVNIGIAVALETGLIVPVIKRADEMNFLGVARAVRDLADRARTKRLSVDDVQEGTFTITNPGIFGSLFGTPIIHQPQVAILGVGAIEKRPVVREDAIAIRPMVYLTLSFDHRALDGAVADQFMGRIKQILEHWEEPVL